MDGLDPVLAALSDTAVRAAVDRQIGISIAGRHDVENESWLGSLAEVRRLRRLVSQQQSRIAELEDKVAALETELSQVEVADLLAAISASVAAADRRLEGYAVNEARIEVKAAVQIAGRRMVVASDPGGLLAPEALSSMAVRLAALPSVAGSEA